MQFIDKVRVHVKAGNGGDGVVTFRREKYVPFGGPDGGDGGNGGSIIFKVDTNRSTLLDLRYHRHIKAQNGQRGKNKNMYGASAKDVIVRVPLGTIVKDLATDRVLADLTKDGQEEVICQGGKGGKGNRHFATARNTVPEHAELGTAGEERDIQVELKVLADVGLIGYPSVGKSTLLSVVSAARPEIADYPFTTLTPQLGSVQVDQDFSFVMADLPGLIEGASQGKGLGFDFLKHIERCRLLVHVLDMSHPDPCSDYVNINKELMNYPGNLEKRPQLVVANKMDDVDAERKLALFRKQFPEVSVFPMIALLKEGTEALLYAIKDKLPQLPVFPLYDAVEATERKLYIFEETEKRDYTIIQENKHRFLVQGERVERMLNNLNLHNEEDALRFSRILRNMGIESALREAGCKNGDEVSIGRIYFNFIESHD